MSGSPPRSVWPEFLATAPSRPSPRRLDQDQRQTSEIPLCGDPRSGEKAHGAGRYRHAVGGDADRGDRLCGTVEQRVDPCAYPAVQHGDENPVDCPAPAAIRVDRTVQTTKIVFEPTRLPNEMSSAVTHSIEVNVEPYYMADRSRPEGRPLRLGLPRDDRQPIRRIREAPGTALANHRRDRPRRGGARRRRSLANSRNSIPATASRYKSGCPLSTPSGIMVGSYTMRNARGEIFEIDIPAFSLNMPGKYETVN